VLVRDVQDVVPVFPTRTYTVDVPENQGAGAEIATVEVCNVIMIMLISYRYQ
jgi:hypothetical protein